MVLPNIQVKTSKSSSSASSEGKTKPIVVIESGNKNAHPKAVNPAKSSSLSNAPVVRNGVNTAPPKMQMNKNIPKKLPTIPHNPSIQPAPNSFQQNPAKSKPVGSIQQNPQITQNPATKPMPPQSPQNAQSAPIYFNVQLGKHSLTNPVSSKIHSASTSVVVPERFTTDYYKAAPNQNSHPLYPTKDNLSNVVSLTIRSAPHLPRHHQRKNHKKVMKKVVKPLVHKKHKKLKQKKKHVKPEDNIKAPDMVEPEPKKKVHPKHKHHRKHTATKYVEVQSRPIISDSSLSATQTYSKNVPIQNVVSKLKNRNVGVLPIKKEDLKHVQNSMFSY